MIDVDRLTYQYAGSTRLALDSVSFSVARGSLTAIIGPSGAGKTTLAMALVGLIPDVIKGGHLAGSVRVAGLDPVSTDVSTMITRVGYLHQSARLHISGVKPTVLEEVAFPLENFGVPRAEILKRIERILTELGLDGLRDRDPQTLSGGETQRVALATVLVLDPDVLVLDEPSSQLDVEGIRALSGIIRRLRTTRTIVLIENRLELVAHLADQVLVFKDGRLARRGQPVTVFADPSPDPDVGAPAWTTLAANVSQALLGRASYPLPATYPATLRWFRRIAPKARRQADLDQVLEPATSTENSCPTSDVQILVEDASYTYPSGVTAVVGINLILHKGERVLVIGRNGSGKSTLLKLLNGVRRPTRGRVVIRGVDSRTVPKGALSPWVAVGFQDPSDQLFAGSVLEEVLLGPRWLNRRDADGLAREALQLVGLEASADLHPYDLHPTQRRFLALACLIAMGSEVCILDEPSAGLSSSDTRQLLGILDALTASGRTLIVVSHDLDLFIGHCDRVILLDSGQLIRDAPVGEFFTGVGRRRLASAGISPPVVTRIGRFAAAVAVTDMPALVAAIRMRGADGSSRGH